MASHVPQQPAPPVQAPPAPVAGAPQPNQGYSMPTPECYGHHPPCPEVPKGGDAPHTSPETCKLCPTQYHCQQESNTRSAG